MARETGRGASGTGVRLVGRAKEMQLLGEKWARAVAGSPSSVLVVGDRGMGKTELVRWLVEQSRQDGAAVASGRCWEAITTPPYWLWIQVVRSLLDELPPATVASCLRGDAGWVAQLVPEVSAFIGDEAGSKPHDAPAAETDRFSLFDALSRFLANVSRKRPLLLVLEDLDEADDASLDLLAFVIRQLEGARAMVIATWNGTHDRRRASATPSIDTIRAEANIVRLRGLDHAHVAQLYAAETGDDAPDAVVAAIHRASEGNPFFVREAARFVAAEGGLERPDHSVGFRVPEAVRNLLRQTLRPLPHDVIEVLSVASAVGVEFDVTMVRDVTNQNDEFVLDALNEAVQAGVVREIGALGRYRFSHVLIRETLYEELSAGERMRLHRAVADALEHRYADDLDAHLETLAHHYFKAAQAGDPEKTVDYAVRAADRAAALAPGDASRLYQRALKVAEAAGLGKTRRKDIARALEKVRGQSAKPAAVAEQEREHALFVREGDFWTVEFAGRAVRLRDAKGMRHLAHLLANPGREMHAFDMVHHVEGGVGAPASTADFGHGMSVTALGGTGPVLDAEAKASYRRRLEELQDDLDEAEQFNDTERAARAHAEIDALLDQLGASVGLGGRDREAASQVERARLSVTKAVRRTIKRIADAHPPLAEHLVATIRTGIYSSYTPDPRMPITWET